MLTLDIEMFDIDSGAFEPFPWQSETELTDAADGFRDPRVNMLQMDDFFFNLRSGGGDSLALLHGEFDTFVLRASRASRPVPEVERRKY